MNASTSDRTQPTGIPVMLTSRREIEEDIARRVAQERATKYLKALHLWDKREGIARQLSGGMKRRLMIARALVHGPRNVVLEIMVRDKLGRPPVEEAAAVAPPAAPKPEQPAKPKRRKNIDIFAN